MPSVEPPDSRFSLPLIYVAAMACRFALRADPVDPFPARVTTRMNPLAGRPYLKMNGLGNEIVVLDLRGTAVRVDAADARAVAAARETAFDQMMVLHDPATPGTEAFVRIYNTDGSEAQACGNG